MRSIFDEVYKGCSVFCEMVVTPEQAGRKAVAACQVALSKPGVAVLGCSGGYL
jgi:pyruvate dehydrogenase (quinone)